MNQPAIVAIAYDRPEALKRLLGSIESAKYPEGTEPVLVISIDKSNSEDVVNVANDFNYSHGRKIVMAREERMGLRAHVLSCGDLTAEYGSVIVLEDDIFVAPLFYEYAVKALDLSDTDGSIGSVSLYDHRFNVHSRESFTAIDDGYDNYYLQLPSSWGQAYTKKQWEAFRQWYDINKDKDLRNPLIPSNITGWSDRSWLKYYTAYMVETGKFCIYPRTSMTTNFGDVGTHAKRADTDLQVPIDGSLTALRDNFSTPGNSQAVYDTFFEPLRDVCGVDGRVIFDLYGIKPVEEMRTILQADYVLSSKSLPYKVVKSFARAMRPIDANIVYNISGNDLFLYDMTKRAAAPAKENSARRHLYEYKGISTARMITIIIYRILEKLGMG